MSVKAKSWNPAACPQWRVDARTSHSPLIGEQAPTVQLKQHLLGGNGPRTGAQLTSDDLTPKQARALGIALLQAADFAEGL